VNDERRLEAALAHAATAFEISLQIGNDTGRLIRRHRRTCRQLDDMLGLEHYPDPNVTVPVICIREVAA
jgi:hypothetical protein